MVMLIADNRWKGQQLDIVDIISFPSDEQESTFSSYRSDNMVSVYTSDSTMITKLLKVVPHDEITVLTVSNSGFITSIKCTLGKKQLSLRRRI